MATDINLNKTEIERLTEKYQQVAKMYNGLATKYNSLLTEYNKLKNKEVEYQNHINRLTKQIQEYQLMIECQQADSSNNNNHNNDEKKIDIEDAINSESIINCNFLGY